MFPFLFVFTDDERSHEDAVQMSRSLWILHNQDVLDHSAAFPGRGTFLENALRRRQAGGAHPRAPRPEGHVPQGEALQEPPEAGEETLGVPGALAQLLRAGSPDGIHGDTGEAV